MRDIASDDSAVGGAAPPRFGPWVGEGFGAVDLKWVAQISSSVSLGADRRSDILRLEADRVSLNCNHQISILWTAIRTGSDED